MKKTKLTRSLLAACSIVALSAVMYGCSSSGDEDELRTSLEEAEAAVAELQDDLDAAEAEVMRIQGELDTATGDTTALRMQLDTATQRVTELEAALPPTEDPDEAGTTAAETKEMAIAAEAGQAVADDAGLGGSGDVTLTMAIERPRSGTEIKFTDSDLMGDDDPKFEMAEDLGRGRTMHVRTMEADEDNGDVVEEVVIVSTDIEAPKATAFAKVDGQTLDVDLDLAMDADNDGTASNDFTALAVDEDMMPVLALVKSDAFSASTAAVLTFARAQADADDDTPGTQPIAAFTTAGTYNGAMGTYMCNATGDDCTVTLDAKGMITAMTDGWIFTPNTGATSDVPDSDYLHYGVWAAEDDGRRRRA